MIIKYREYPPSRVGILINRIIGYINTRHDVIYLISVTITRDHIYFEFNKEDSLLEDRISNLDIGRFANGNLVNEQYYQTGVVVEVKETIN